ncbi:NmrA-like family protein [Talaromyces stipitatus ATCC 10500]|uniref:NmrA-like family protein n=1 Tax=Talaromyces stipitatus (strain ATCC 10500 / CBS 375.48 / QM 6759 / NRRL 1006) TaxID=441959 RepID=B8ML77_TALSN|nr:NmrA-like family protein [Talaromyces stipitatus ATCC 10500]EED14992.1 NmrA-like family protein [Talaromyces stipitatus ATCC 10500]
MASLKNIAIIGASGSIGKIILDALIKAPQFNVTVLSRASSETTFPTGVSVRKSDFSDSDLVSALKGQDAVISVVGPTGFAEQKKFIDAAISAGVKRFLPSEYSANTLSPAVLQLLPLFNQKKETLEYLKTKESSGFSWTAIYTALLFDWGLGNGFLGFDVSAHTATIWDDGSKVFTLTNADQLGRAVVSVLEHPEKTANKNLYVASAETSQKEILAALEKATGSKFAVTNTTTEKELSEAGEKLSKGDFSGALILVRATSFGSTPGIRANYAKEEELANDLLGLKLESVDETVARVVKGSS